MIDVPQLRECAARLYAKAQKIGFKKSAVQPLYARPSLFTRMMMSCHTLLEINKPLVLCAQSELSLNFEGGKFERSLAPLRLLSGGHTDNICNLNLTFLPNKLGSDKALGVMRLRLDH